MRKWYVGVFFLMFSVPCLAQQKPHYTQYVQNQYIINPAITGIENYTDVKLSHRHQWVGFQGAPVTTYFTAHKSLGGASKDVAPYNAEGENARGKSYWESYTSAEPHHGIGIQVVNDKMGPLSNASAALTYAYHLGLGEKTSLAAGFGLGINQMTLDASKLQFYKSTVDPSVYNSNELNTIKPNISAGLYLYSSNFFLGLSAQQIVPQKVDFSNGVVQGIDNNVIPHLFATAGSRLLVGDYFNLFPSVLVKLSSQSPVQTEFNLKLLYQDFAWGGVSYRSGDAFSGLIGLNITQNISVGYSYDYATSNLNNFSRGSHELLIGFIINSPYGDTCPRNVW